MEIENTMFINIFFYIECLTNLVGHIYIQDIHGFEACKIGIQSKSKVHSWPKVWHQLHLYYLGYIAIFRQYFLKNKF